MAKAAPPSASQITEAQSKLWKLASNPFTVLGEARVTENGITLTCLGDTAPEEKLGLAPGTFPGTVQENIAMMHPDDIRQYQEVLEDSLATGAAFDSNYRLSDGVGGWRWIEGRAVPVEVRNRQPVGWVFVARDFTAQQEVEAALRRSVQELEASRLELRSEREKLWRLAANAFSVLGEARVTETGIEMEFFGDESPEVKVGLLRGTVPRNLKTLLAMMHPDDVKSYVQKMEHSLATGEPLGMVYRLSDGRGGWRWVQVRAISLEARDGKHVRWLHDTRDVTEQKELEEALRRSVDELQQLKAKLQAENLFLRQEAGLEAAHAEIIGQSDAQGRVLEQVGRWRPRLLPCSSPARRARARSWLRARSTSAVNGGRACSWR